MQFTYEEWSFPNEKPPEKKTTERYCTPSVSPSNPFSAYLKAQRIHRRFTIEHVAESVNIDATLLSLVEKGVRFLTREQMEALELFFGVASK